MPKSSIHWANDCPDKDDKGEVGDDKQKGSKNRVRFMNALAIIPDDGRVRGICTMYMMRVIVMCP